MVQVEDWENKRGKTIAMIVLGIIAPFVWAGLYLGPVLVIVAGLVPILKP